jgi:hypothetical protein
MQQLLKAFSILEKLPQKLPYWIQNPHTGFHILLHAHRNYQTLLQKRTKDVSRTNPVNDIVLFQSLPSLAGRPSGFAYDGVFLPSYVSTMSIKSYHYFQ